jgi:hypothetical protein
MILLQASRSMPLTGEVLKREFAPAALTLVINKEKPPMLRQPAALRSPAVREFEQPRETITKSIFATELNKRRIVGL